jgi:uncharacterized protein YndB with AHSA1/START domain
MPPLARPFALTVVAAAAATGAYLALVRPRILTCGATADEAAAALPGEEVVPHARVRSTSAITIDAPPEQVWPWLNQIGQDRAGLYSATWLENLAGLQFRNAEEVHAQWQLQVGDLVRFAPAEQGDFGMTVLRSEPPHLLVLGPGPRTPEGAGPMTPVWIFSLREVDGATRLVVRFRSDYAPTPMGHLANKWLLEPIHFFMERSMLHGLAARAASHGSMGG